MLATGLRHGPLEGWGGFLYVDSLSGFFLLTVSAVVLLVAGRPRTWPPKKPAAR
jgi:formate hydrogenlyase subunit 3/multisubunit Na+/H+ antiporter MnhD subunit